MVNFSNSIEHDFSYNCSNPFNISEIVDDIVRRLSWFLEEKINLKIDESISKENLKNLFFLGYEEFDFGVSGFLDSSVPKLEDFSGNFGLMKIKNLLFCILALIL